MEKIARTKIDKKKYLGREIYFIVKNVLEKEAGKDIYFSDICKISRMIREQIIELPDLKEIWGGK